MKKIKKIKTDTPYWQRLADKVARSFAPEIYPCAKCGYPVVTGYCCTHCLDDNPEKSRSRSRTKLNGEG